MRDCRCGSTDKADDFDKQAQKKHTGLVGLLVVEVALAELASFVL
jgi:hypothetical protein